MKLNGFIGQIRQSGFLPNVFALVSAERLSRLRRWYWQAFQRTADGDSANTYYRSISKRE